MHRRAIFGHESKCPMNNLRDRRWNEVRRRTRRRLGALLVVDDHVTVGNAPGQRAGEHEVENLRKAEHVGSGCRTSRIGHLLRSAKRRRAHHHSGSGRIAQAVDDLGDPEIQDLDALLEMPPGGILDHHVVGLQITMDHTAVVCVLERSTHLKNEVSSLPEGQPAVVVGEVPSERCSVDEFESQEQLSVF